MGIYNLSTPIPPIQFQKAMVFIDGTNLFYRLEAAKLSLIKTLQKSLLILQIVAKLFGSISIPLNNT
jgi:hypothetical protein